MDTATARTSKADVPEGHAATRNGWIVPAVASAIFTLLWTPFVIAFCYGLFFS